MGAGLLDFGSTVPAGAVLIQGATVLKGVSLGLQAVNYAVYRKGSLTGIISNAAMYLGELGAGDWSASWLDTHNANYITVAGSEILRSSAAYALEGNLGTIPIVPPYLVGGPTVYYLPDITVYSNRKR
jgi:hypothetical protein